MSVSLAKYTMLQGKSALHVEAMELCESVKDTFGGGESSKLVMQKYIQPNLLIVDEFNRGLSEYDTRLIQRIISRRYDTLRDTILISNEEPDEFGKLAGDRVMSRVNELGGVHEFTWESFRN